MEEKYYDGKHMARMETTAFAERCDIASQSNNVN
jgi:hypothetical protein